MKNNFIVNNSNNIMKTIFDQTPREKLIQIAAAFSNGNFELAFPYLADDVLWNVVGEDYFEGKNAVIDNGHQIANYFKSVTTNFRTINVIADNTRVAINGTAEFIRDGKRVNFVSACDVYEFNDNNELQTITSYCIADKK
ncbi:MAG: hypothetical protein BGN92_07390 [Sphingobacteriales bacterium 41-5]|nr:MAG: hypothetical protein BGN92_07390 [Sphingobacteriales bacterium 41-5]